jgi:lipopolysaccharide transport system permease protein
MTLTIPRLELIRALQVLYRNRALTLELAKRDITDRYAGQLFGVLWAIGHPFILVLVYAFIFGQVFALKIGGTVDMPLDYTAYLLAGLLPWLTFQESLSKGALAVVGNANLVKQVVFPIEVLPAKVVLASLLTQLVGTLCLAAYVLITTGGLPWTYALLPVLWAFQTLAMIGASMILAAVGAYFRDIKDLVQVGCIVGMYLMPVTYLPQWVPDMLRPVLYLNPLSYMTWCYQDLAYYGRIEHWWAWPVFILGATFIFAAGFRVFGKLKMYFGNVL